MPSINTNTSSLPIVRYPSKAVPTCKHCARLAERRLIADVPHAGVNSADLNYVARSWRVDHLTIANINTRMVAV